MPIHHESHTGASWKIVMGIAYRILAEEGITVVAWHDLVTAQMFLRHVERLAADPEWPPPQGLQLADMTTIFDEKMMDGEFVQSIAEVYSEQIGRSIPLRIAVVASEALAHTPEFQKFIACYPPSLKVFHTLESATAWLGVDVQTVRPVLEELRRNLDAHVSTTTMTLPAPGNQH